MSKLDCAACGLNSCYTVGHANRAHDACPMTTTAQVLGEASEKYDRDDNIKSMAHAAALVEAQGYMKWTRVEDTIEFARLMGFTKLGIACCVGLKREGAILENILRKNGFEVSSAICKAGGEPKEKVGVSDQEKVHPGQFEAMCNPVAQAMLLDSAGSQLNILVGLCVGHDSLFTKTSKAPVTTLIAKDRVLCHNPIAAIYNHQSYYRKKLYEEHAIPGHVFNQDEHRIPTQNGAP
jgi:uncharacterized metal-binding protein